MGAAGARDAGSGVGSNRPRGPLLVPLSYRHRICSFRAGMFRLLRVTARSQRQPTSATALRPALGRTGLFMNCRGGGAISHLALCAGLCTVATVVVAAVDPSAREAANHLGDHLVGAMGGQTSASPEATRDDRAFLPNRPSADDVIHAQADPSDFTGDFGQFLADQARDDRLGQDSFKSADGTVPKQVQVAGWPLIPLLAGGGGATAGGAAAGGGSAAAGATVGLAGTFLAWLGIRNAPPELDLVARALNPLEIIGAALGLTDASPEMELVSRVLLNPAVYSEQQAESAFMDLEEARPTSNATPRPPPLNDTLVTKPTDYRPGAEGYRGEDGESVRQDPGFAPVVVDTSGSYEQSLGPRRPH